MHGDATIEVYDFQWRLRSSFLSTLPTLDSGRTSTNSALRGILYPAISVPAVALDRLERGFGARLEHDHRMHGLAPLLVRHADHGDLRHGRVARQRTLHLGGIDVLAAADDHVLHAVHQEHEAIRVHVAAIAGVHPAVAHGLGRRLRLVPVAEHHVGAAHGDLPHRAARGTSRPCGSTIFTSTIGAGRPTECILPLACPASLWNSGPSSVATGASSVMP